MGEMVCFDCSDGSSAEGHLAKSPGARAGVVVLQEWWGLNDQIKGIADRLAREGCGGGTASAGTGIVNTSIRRAAIPGQT